jgi:hypothetical protein
MYEQVAVKGKFQRFSDRYGWKGWLTILFYPVLTLVTTPIRLVQTLWNCRVLANGKWGDYNHFNPRSGLNSLFYWTQAENLYRFGRCGTSPYIGVGKYFLGKWWHLSLVSTYAYWKGGCIVPLLGMFGWWIGHVLWLGQVGASVGWVLIVMALTLFCTTFYSNSFVMQNYNAMGWLFMPIGLYGSASGNWGLAAFAWLGASFGSFTVVLLAAVLSIVSALQAWSLMPVATLIPAGLKLATHFWPFLQDGNAWQSIRDTAKGVGLSRRKARYVRRNTRFRLERYYYLGIYGQFVVCYWIFDGTLPLLLIVALTIWITNF